MIAFLLEVFFLSLNIGSDFDGLVVDSHSLKPIIAKEMFGVDIAPERFIKSIVVGEGILTLEQYRAVGVKMFTGNYPMKAVPGAVEHLLLLQQARHSVRIVTSRNEAQQTLKPAMIWLSKTRLRLPVIGVGYMVSKLEACKGLDVYMDDDSEKLIPLVGIVPHLLFFSRPENMHEQTPQEVVRIGSWREAYEYIRRIKTF